MVLESSAAARVARDRLGGAASTELARVPGVAGVTASHYAPFTWDDNASRVRREGADPFSRIQYHGSSTTASSRRTGLRRSRGECSRASSAPSAFVSPTQSTPADVVSTSRPRGCSVGRLPRRAGQVAGGGRARRRAAAPIVGVVSDTPLRVDPLRRSADGLCVRAAPRARSTGLSRDASIRSRAAISRRRSRASTRLGRSLTPTSRSTGASSTTTSTRSTSAEQRQGQLFTFFSALAIGIACLGLLGLAWFTTERRTKEIGIRKTIGGRYGTSSAVHGRVRPARAARELVAWPLAYVVMQRWLAGFAYRIEMSPLVLSSEARSRSRWHSRRWAPSRRAQRRRSRCSRCATSDGHRTMGLSPFNTCRGRRPTRASRRLIS